LPRITNLKIGAMPLGQSNGKSCLTGDRDLRIVVEKTITGATILRNAKGRTMKIDPGRESEGKLSDPPTRVGRRSFLGQLAAGTVAASVLLPAAEGAPAENRQAAPAVAPSQAPSGTRGKTERVDSEIREFRDPDTGARLRQLTGGGSDNVHLYFTSESFVTGADTIVFGSNRSGSFQLYLLEIGDRRLTQLTAVRHHFDPQQACLTPAGRVFYFEGPALHSLEINTLKDREIYRAPDGWRPGLLTCTANGSHVAFAYEETMAVSTETGRIYATMAESYYQHRRCVIMRIETATGKAEAAWGEVQWISHVLIHPTDPNLILFCHEGGSYSSQRMWTVNIAAARGRQAVPLFPQKPNEYCVHEYWTRGGEVGFQYEVEREGRIEAYNCFLQPDGTWLREFLLPGRRPGHIQSNSANTLVVADGGYLSADDKQGGQYIALMTAPNGRVSVHRLCRYQVGETQHSHGHPVFSLDDRWVLFNSRIGPRDNIFMAEVGSI
jgi:oligogalacturonide lyase